MATYRSTMIKTLWILIIPILISFQGVAYAADANAVQEYQPLAPIALGTAPLQQTDAISYVKNLFIFSIAACVVLAIIMIILGGIQYMSTDAMSGKSEGKQRIQNALWGLLLAMTSILILYTINPNITNISVLTTKAKIDPLTGTTKEIKTQYCATSVFSHDSTELDQSGNPLYAAGTTKQQCQPTIEECLVMTDWFKKHPSQVPLYKATSEGCQKSTEGSNSFWCFSLNSTDVSHTVIQSSRVNSALNLTGYDTVTDYIEGGNTHICFKGHGNTSRDWNLCQKSMIKMQSIMTDGGAIGKCIPTPL